MKAFLFLVPALPALTAIALAQAEREPQMPPPISQAASPAEPHVGGVDNQRLYGASGATLIARETADGILENFHKVYAVASTPRVVIYVNRELVDLDSGLKLTGHTEKYETTSSPAPADAPDKATGSSPLTKTSGENTYQVKDSVKGTLADKQTVREIERLFGRVFRNGGARLADQKSAASLLDEKPDGRLVGDAAAKDRAALSNIADIAIEVLISSRNLTLPELAGDKTYAVPDIQATAIRLKDSAIIGQAAASDVLGKDLQAGRVLRQFDVRDITEATALALMEDMLTGAK